MSISCVAVKLFLPFVFLFPAPTALWMFSFSCVRLRQQCSARNNDDLLVLRRTAGMAKSKKSGAMQQKFCYDWLGKIICCVFTSSCSQWAHLLLRLHPGCVKFLVNVACILCESCPAGNFILPYISYFAKIIHIALFLTVFSSEF